MTFLLRFGIYVQYGEMLTSGCITELALLTDTSTYGEITS